MAKGRGRGGDIGECATTCVPCLLITVFFVGCFLLGFAFDTVEVNQSAVLQYSLTKDIDRTTVYGPGRYLVGLARDFRIYPTIVQTMEFADPGEACRKVVVQESSDNAPDVNTCHSNVALDAWSLDGQDLTLTLSIMYRLVPEEVIDIYETYKGGDTPWQAPYIEAVKSVLKEASTHYKATEFFEKRIEISDDMKLKTFNVLRPKHAELIYFQLRTVSIPRSLEQSILAKVTAKQYKLTRIHTNGAAIKRQQIGVLLDTSTASANRIQLEAAARANLVQQQAEATKLELQVEGEANAFKTFGDKLGLTPADTVYYRYLRMIKNKKSGFDKLLVGGTNQILVNTK